MKKLLLLLFCLPLLGLGQNSLFKHDLSNSIVATKDPSKTIGIKLNSLIEDKILFDHPKEIFVNIPFFNNIDLAVTLSRFDITDKFLKVISKNLDGEDYIEMQPSIVSYKIIYKENSIGIMNFYNGIINSSFQIDNNQYEISIFNNQYILFEASNSINTSNFSCQVEEEVSNLNNNLLSGNSFLPVCIEFALEIDLYTRQTFNSDLEATNWALAIFAGVSQLYEAQTNATISVQSAYIWNITDPYAAYINDAGNMLNALASHWQNNNGGIARDLVHLLSKRNNTGIGGIAWLNTLCSTSFGYAFSSELNNDTTYSFPNPSYSWNLMVCAHEIGHNVGSSHTHECVWNSDPTYGFMGPSIDDCGVVSGATSACIPPAPAPAGGFGTIMSYCHVGGSGIVLNFHNIVISQALNPGIASAGCLTTCSFDGCTDSIAYNYDPSAITDDGLCCYNAGCTDPSALNYDSLSCYNDNSCAYPVYGCADPTATNYDPTATNDDGSCCYGSSANLQVYTNDQCGATSYMGFELLDSNGVVLASGGQNAGETWQDYFYYDYCLTINDSCDIYQLVLYDTYGYGWYGCSQASASALVTSANGDTLLYFLGNGGFYPSYSIPITGSTQGCTDPTASNYEVNAVCDDGSCTPYAGCTDPFAFNYDSLVTIDDGSCCYDLNGCSCSQLHSNNGVNQEGWGFWSSFRGAIDLLVHNNENFELSNIKLNMWYVQIGDFITSVTVNYHLDSLGFPGSVIGSEIITNVPQTYITNNGWDIYELTLNLNPFIFNGSLVSDSIYWISLSNGVSNSGSNFYWESNSDLSNSVYPLALYDATSWIYADSGYSPQEFIYELEGNCISLINAGCMDSLAYNYDSLALYDDGSCCYGFGCNDPIANNYNPVACFDDGSCTYNYGCTDSSAANYDPSATMDDGSCINCIQYAVDTLSYTGAMQTFTVPAGVTSITVDAYGAQGGNTIYLFGGLGASMQGEFIVTPGQQIDILVGEQPTNNNGGGGGSFVVENGTNAPLLIAGGGGGASGDCCGLHSDGMQGVSTTDGTSGFYAGCVTGVGGTSGYGGSGGDNSASGSGGGGGFSSDGGSGKESNSEGKSYLNGGAGGDAYSDSAFVGLGGYGGGGGGADFYYYTFGAGGGGGGYSGGGGNCGGSDWGNGGGGGSYNIGANQNNTSGVQTGNGLVIISYSIQTCAGCTDLAALNYDSLALYDDGSCIICDLTTSITFLNASSPSACDGFVFANATSSYSSVYFTWYDNSNTIIAIGSNFILNLCYGDYYLQSYDTIGCLVVDTFVIGDLYGCTNPTALNYNPVSNIDDGSCVYCVYGCTDSTAINYNLLSTCDDGSCISIVYGCTDSTAFNYYSGANTDDGSCLYCDLNISLIVMQNSTPSACDGWVFANATTSYIPLNYSWSTGGTVNNIIGLCTGIYSLLLTDNVGCTIDTTITIVQISVSGCIDSLSCNYDPLANIDDGSCNYFCLGCTNLSPTGAYVHELTHDRARINWDNMNDSNCMVTQYRIKYRELGTSTWSQKNMENTGLCQFGLNTTSKIILGLSNSTTYEYYMKAWYCGGGVSSWSAIQNFITADECENVINFAVSTPTNTKASFTWDSTSAYSFARIKLRVDTTGGVWNSAGGFGVFYPALTKVKNGLMPGASYRAQARTWCDPTGGAYRSASWSPLVFWTQPTSIRTEGGSAINNLFIYPNPSRYKFNISFSSDTKQDLKVRILNVVGEELINENLEQFIGEYTKQINLSNNAKGIYFLEIETNDGIINKKLILQ